MTSLGARATAPRTRGHEPRVEALIARYRQTGDRRLRERAVRQSMPLARRLALRFHNGREPLEDLVQVANVGLVKAVDRFDPERGNRFSSFAVPTIAGELRRHFRASAWTLHVPRSPQESFLLVREATERLGQRSGRPPTIGELSRATAARMGCSQMQISRLLRRSIALLANR